MWNTWEAHVAVMRFHMWLQEMWTHVNHRRITCCWLGYNTCETHGSVGTLAHVIHRSSTCGFHRASHEKHRSTAWTNRETQAFFGHNTCETQEFNMLQERTDSHVKLHSSNMCLSCESHVFAFLNWLAFHMCYLWKQMFIMSINHMCFRHDTCKAQVVKHTHKWENKH